MKKFIMSFFIAVMCALTVGCSNKMSTPASETEKTKPEITIGQEETYVFNGREYKAEELSEQTIKWLKMDDEERAHSSWCPPEFGISNENAQGESAVNETKGAAEAIEGFVNLGGTDAESYAASIYDMYCENPAGFMEMLSAYPEETVNIITAFINEENALNGRKNSQESANYTPDDYDLVRVKDYIPDIYSDIKYAGKDNFTGKCIYDFNDVYLRYGTVKKLIKVQNALSDYGYALLIWDGYRPQAAQFKLWETAPDPSYVSDPYNGHSKHSNGGTLDVTLVDSSGNELQMPSGFDEFSALADRDYTDVSDDARKNAELLQKLMYENGFEGYFKEWWHFYDTVEYGYDDIQPLGVYSETDAKVINCDEFISLRQTPNPDAEKICKIKLGETVMLLGGSYGDYLKVGYDGHTGYVMGEYIAK